MRTKHIMFAVTGICLFATGVNAGTVVVGHYGDTSVVMPSISPANDGAFNITYIQADGYHEQETFVGQGNLFSANLSLGGGGTSVTNVQQLNSSPIMVGFGGVHPWANFMKPFRRGDLVVNMLPTMDGGEARRLGPQAARDECLRRVRAHWRHMQTTLAEFQRYRIVWIAPALGVRDGYRLVGRYVLTEHDLLAGCGGQRHPDVIAIADHAMDTHGVPGGRGGCHELAQPYGIPYRCLLPKELDRN